MIRINVLLLLHLYTFLVISDGINSMATKDIEQKAIIVPTSSSTFDDLVNSKDAVMGSTQTGSIYDHIPKSKTFSKTSTSQVLM